MALVIEELHVQITATQERLVAAIKADDANGVARHRARLQDLIDMAARHGIDVRAWVDQALLQLTTSRGRMGRSSFLQGGAGAKVPRPPADGLYGLGRGLCFPSPPHGRVTPTAWTSCSMGSVACCRFILS
jgi:hypothetical protein